jgi:hypothetical protein
MTALGLNAKSAQALRESAYLGRPEVADRLPRDSGRGIRFSDVERAWRLRDYPLHQSRPDAECLANLHYTRAALVEAEDVLFQLSPRVNRCWRAIYLPSPYT